MHFKHLKHSKRWQTQNTSLYLVMFKPYSSFSVYTRTKVASWLGEEVKLNRTVIFFWFTVQETIRIQSSHDVSVPQMPFPTQMGRWQAVFSLQRKEGRKKVKSLPEDELVFNEYGVFSVAGKKSVSSFNCFLSKDRIDNVSNRFFPADSFSKRG